MAIITVNKDNSNLTLTVNTLQIVDTLSKQTDYITEKSKGIYIYYNLSTNCLYTSVPVGLEQYLGWGSTERESIVRWIPTFNDYYNSNCLQNYINWLHGNFNVYTILYGQLDILGDVNKPAHILIDAHFNCTPSICIGIYRKTLSIAGLQQTIAADLQKALQVNKHIRIDNGKLAVVV